MAVTLTYLKVGQEQTHNSSSEEMSHVRGAYPEMGVMMLNTVTLLSFVSITTISVIILMSAVTLHLRDRVIFVVMPVI